MSFASELRQMACASPAPRASARAMAGAARHRPLRPAAATAHPYAKSFACAVAAWAVASALLLTPALRDLPPDAVGPAVARIVSAFAVASFVPGLVTGMLVQQSPRAWPVWRIALLSAVLFCLVAALQWPGTAVTGI